MFHRRLLSTNTLILFSHAYQHARKTRSSIVQVYFRMLWIQISQSASCHLLAAGDKSAVVPGGVRIGSPALTTRGFMEEDFVKVADFIHEAVGLAKKAKGQVEGTKLKDYLEYVQSPGCGIKKDIEDLRERVEKFATQFPIPGVDTDVLYR